MRETRDTARLTRSALAIPGVDAPVEVRRHPAARRMTLRVSRTHRAVILTLPMRCEPAAVSSFVTRHAEWLKQKLGNLPEPVPFVHGAIVPLRGELHRVQLAPGRGVVRPVAADDGDPAMLRVTGAADTMARRLTEWLMAEARRDLDQRVDHHARRLGVRAKRISVRDQLSRWGSCSTTGVLSFSWRLVLAPTNVLDYVAAHEVAHLREMNHGKKFWALVRETMPEMDAARAWLYAHGTDLHRYGASA